MTKSPVTKALEELDKRITKAKAQYCWLEDNEKWLNKCPFHIDSLYDQPRIIVHNTVQLHKARIFLRKALGNWEDEYKHAFYCVGAIAVFDSPERTDISIWLECHPDDFPPELLNKGCEWVKSESADYNLICPTNN